jgi:selenoprotein W-related protein
MEKALPKFKWDVDEWQLVPSDGGRFELLVEGELVFSKLAQGRFPEPNEAIDLISKQLAARSKR